VKVIHFDGQFRRLPKSVNTQGEHETALNCSLLRMIQSQNGCPAMRNGMGRSHTSIYYLRIICLP
jgi:hypothetical protein